MECYKIDCLEEMMKLILIFILRIIVYRSELRAFPVLIKTKATLVSIILFVVSSYILNLVSWLTFLLIKFVIGV